MYFLPEYVHFYLTWLKMLRASDRKMDRSLSAFSTLVSSTICTYMTAHKNLIFSPVNPIVMKPRPTLILLFIGFCVHVCEWLCDPLNKFTFGFHKKAFHERMLEGDSEEAVRTTVISASGLVSRFDCNRKLVQPENINEFAVLLLKAQWRYNCWGFALFWAVVKFGM